MTVHCLIEEAQIKNEQGRMVRGVRCECEHCGHTTESFGTGDGSRRRCLALMREQCPEDEENFYVED